jgi:hypothetical protein
LESHPQVKWLRERIAIVKKRLEKAKAAPATQPPGGSLDTRPWTGEPKIPAPLPAGQTASFTLKPLVGEITTTWPCVDLDTGRESTLGQSSASSAGDLIVTRMQGQPQSLIFVVDRAELREMPKGQDTSGLWDAPNPAAALALATEPGSFAYPARQAPYVLAYKTKFGQVGLIKVEDASPEQARISIRLLISKAAPATSRSAPAAAPATGPEAVSGTDSQVRRLEREIAESEEQLELYIRTQHVLESHPQVKSMREKIAALKERLEKAKAAPATQASETADKTAVTEAALNVLKAIKDDDLNALKDLSAGAVQGWVQAPSEPAAILAGTEGWTVDYLKSAAREIRRTLAKSPEFGQGVVETAIQGDFAATRSPAVKSGSSEQYLIMVFVRTNKGWRFATMHDARGPLAEELSKHTLRIPANLKRMGVPATQTNQSSSRLSVLLRALFCALDTTEDKLMEADIHGITCGRPSPACCLLRAWRPSQVDWRSRLPSRAWSPGRA